MSVLRAQVTIPRDTGVPEDVSVNTWHFNTTDEPPLEASLTGINSALLAFYGGIDQLLSPLNANPATLKIYNLDQPAPRPIIAEYSWTLTYDTAVSGHFPEEVAICMSFKGVQAAGAPMSRRRGRVYLGPIAPGTQATLAGRCHVSPATVTAIVAAGSALKAASVAATTWKWGIYSPTTRANAQFASAGFFEVAAGWVDNAYDTQRRRGPKAQLRSTF